MPWLLATVTASTPAARTASSDDAGALKLQALAGTGVLPSVIAVSRFTTATSAAPSDRRDVDEHGGRIGEQLGAEHALEVHVAAERERHRLTVPTAGVAPGRARGGRLGRRGRPWLGGGDVGGVGARATA